MSRHYQHRRPKLSGKESQQKYKDLYGNPNKRPEKLILQKNSQLRSLTLLPVCAFCCRHEPFSVSRLSRVILKYQG